MPFSQFEPFLATVNRCDPDLGNVVGGCLARDCRVLDSSSSGCPTTNLNTTSILPSHFQPTTPPEFTLFQLPPDPLEHPLHLLSSSSSIHLGAPPPSLNIRYYGTPLSQPPNKPRLLSNPHHHTTILLSASLSLSFFLHSLFSPFI